MNKIQTIFFPRLAVGIFVLSACLSAAYAEIELIKTIAISGSMLDLSGFDEPLAGGIPHNSFGGISALEYSGEKDLYFALPDRGPKDGAVDWVCRAHLVRISLDPNIDSANEFSVEKTFIFCDGTRTFSGLATRLNKSDLTLERFDPEGMRLGSNKNVYVADEYGPSLFEFDSTGKKIRSLQLPSRYRVSAPRATKTEENQANQSGRQSNRGIEGLAIDLKQNRLFGLFQSPLLQDCDRTTGNKPTGLNCRLFEFDLAAGFRRELLYPLESKKNKLNEILRFSDREFLVIERDGKSGVEARFKKIMLIDVSGCSDIQNFARLPASRIPEGVKPVRKKVFIDLLDEKFGLCGERMPEKIEGLAFGPKLPDGRRTLLVMSDNDFSPKQPTLIYCFAIGHANRITETTSR